jgi:hypothetical protein
MPKPSEDSYTSEETAQRRDAALRRALNTPPQPKHGKVKESKVRRANPKRPEATKPNGN